MNPRTEILALILLLLLLTLSAFPSNAQAQSRLQLTVVRTVKIGDYGLATVEDSFKVRNNSTEPIREMLTGFHRVWGRDLRFVEAKDNETRTLQVDLDINSTSPIYWIRINFGRPVELNQTYVFTVKALFTNLIKLFQLGYVYNFTTAPILTVRADVANVTVVGPFGSDFKVSDRPGLNTTNLEGRPAVFTRMKPLTSYFNRTLAMNFTSVNQFILKIDRAKRIIDIAAEGPIFVSDEYHMFNSGVVISTIPFKLPKGARNIMAYDPGGPMWTEPRQIQDITITPFRTQQLKVNQSMTLTLKYELPREQYVKQIAWWGVYNFTFDFLSNLQHWVIEDLDVTINYPRGLSIQQVTGRPFAASAASTFQDQLEYRLTGVSPLHNLTLVMTYRYVTFWASIKPVSWVVAFEIALVGFAVVLRARRPPALEVPVPVEKMREFVELYDDKMGLRMELERMDEELARGALTKHDFRRRRKIIDLRLDQLNKLLVGVKTELRVIHPRYDDMIRRIDRAEAEVDATRASQSQITGQYRTGKITRETYETVSFDLSKRLDRARELIETTIVTLREEAR